MTKTMDFAIDRFEPDGGALHQAIYQPLREQIVQAGRVPVSLCFLMFDDQNHGFRKKSNAELFDAASILFW